MELYSEHTESKAHSVPTIAFRVSSSLEDGDIVYMAHPSGRGELGNTRSTSDSDPSSRARFVAGEAFFNYAAFGSLRDGESLNLLSITHIGLVAHAVVAGFITTFFQYAFQPLLVTYMSLYHEEQVVSAKYLLLWPGTLSVLIGLCSDCLPIAQFRRKSYMILGWVIAAVMFACVGTVNTIGDTTFAANGRFYVLVSFLAAFGIQVGWIASLAMTVEFAQREHLYERGCLQSLFYLFYFAAAATTQGLIAHIVYPPEFEASITLGQAAFIMVGASLTIIPFIVFFLNEERVAPKSRAAFSKRTAEVWSSLQQKVVYKIFVFLCGVIFLVNAHNESVHMAISLWSGIAPSQLGTVLVAKAAPKVLAVIIWRYYLTNISWPKVAFIGITLYVACSLALLIPTTYDQLRKQWYFYLVTAIGEIPQGWFELLGVIIPTEIANIGREGATMGLVSSFMVLITIATFTLWDSLNDAIGISVPVQDILADSSTTRAMILQAGVAYAVINLCSLAILAVLPTQKLDAQQLRAFGGYNRYARYLIVGGFLLLLIYDLVANLVMIF